MSVLPAGKLKVHLHGSTAPDPDTIMGRPHIPLIASALTQAGAAVKGFVESPLHPFQRRDELLASWDRGFDADVLGGARLRAFDAMSGRYVIHLTPKRLEDGYTINVSLAPAGDEKNAVVETNPHAPNRPVGFYNRAEAKAALGEIRRVLDAALADPDAARVDKLRAESIKTRLDATVAYLDTLEAAEEQSPVLAKLKQAREDAYESRKPGDARDQSRAAIVKEIEGVLQKGDHGLSAEVVAQVREDLDTVAAERKKWHTWRASTGLFTLWVRE